MRVFIYEYTCACPADARLTHRVRREGAAMLAALLADFARIPGVRALTLLGRGAPMPSHSRVEVMEAFAERATFESLAASAEATLVIAPEFDDILASRCDWVIGAGGRLLGPSAEAVRLTADKLALAAHLKCAALPTPACQRAGVDPPPSFPVVYKPRYGAGSLATFLVRTPSEWTSARRAAVAEDWRGEGLVQTYAPGRPVSVAFLVGPGVVMPLPAASQRLSRDGRFRYLGGTLPLPAPLARRATTLARRAIETVPGLHGYVGVDLVLGDAADGSADQVIEINPRITTSYVGLRALARTNLAAAMLDVAQGKAPRLAWKRGRVSFRADGRVCVTRPAAAPRAAAPWRKTP